MPCTEIAADWGAQRIKELSVSRALLHSVKSVIKSKKSIEQKNTDTSLIEQFLYPKLGPGQMWETVASLIEEKGGIIIKNSEVVELNITDYKVHGVSYLNKTTNLISEVKGDYFFSSMPVKELIKAMGKRAPVEVKRVGEGLQYRDFITVGLLLNKLKIKNKKSVFRITGFTSRNVK